MDQAARERWGCTRHGDEPHRTLSTKGQGHPAHEGPAGYYSEDHGHCNCAHGYDGHGSFGCPNAEIVVLHCTCGDPESHLPHHCPEATVHPIGTTPDERRLQVMAFRTMRARAAGKN